MFTVRTVNFERLVQELAVDHRLFIMDPKGTPIREQVFEGKPCFLLTDHIPMPKKTFGSLERLGAKKLTLGKKMLFASQCVVLIHHALDGRGGPCQAPTRFSLPCCSSTAGATPASPGPPSPPTKPVHALRPASLLQYTA